MKKLKRLTLCISILLVGQVCGPQADKKIPDAEAGDERVDGVKKSGQQINKESLVLIEAARSCQPNRFAALLQTSSPVLINWQGAGGETALTHAVWFGKRECVWLLIQKDARLNLRTEGGATALHYAIQRNHIDIAHLLLDAGASPDVPENQGRTPLMYAAGLGHADLTHLMLKSNARLAAQDFMEMSALMHAISGGHPAVASSLIKPVTVNQVDHNVETALFYALRNEQDEILEALLAAGADVNHRNRFGETPLMLAAWLGRMSAVAILLNHGADPGIQDLHNSYNAARIARAADRLVMADWLELWEQFQNPHRP